MHPRNLHHAVIPTGGYTATMTHSRELTLALSLSCLLACKGTAEDDDSTTAGSTTDTSATSTPTSTPTGGETDTTDTTGTTGLLHEDENTIALGVNRDVDLLFVIDNSGSMAEEQARLAAAFPALIGILEAPDNALNYRIGFTTTDAGNPRCPSTTPEAGNLVLSSCVDRVDQGEFTAQDLDFSEACTAGCTLRDSDLQILPTATQLDDNKTPRKWLENSFGATNVGGASMLEALQCYAPQGVAGCGFESHLESMYLALASAKMQSSKNNYGFLRDTAVLSVVIVSDETDCSFNPEFKDIFTTNKVFWNDPANDVAPTSAMCWAAGVACEGQGPNFDTCRSSNHDSGGNPDVGDDSAVLHPLTKYIDFVYNIEQNKQQYDSNSQVLVSLISGVPIGYDSFESEIQYADSPDPEFNSLFGIGPGCIVGPVNAPESTAVPPVREREFAEAFNVDDEEGRNLYSICDDDFSSSLAAIGDQIRDQIKPICMPNCVQDTMPETSLVEPECSVYDENLVEDTKTPLPACVEGPGPAWVVPDGETACFAMRVDTGDQTPSSLDDMTDECVLYGFNLEFVIVRTAPTPPATTVSAACKLSDNKKKDCPTL